MTLMLTQEGEISIIERIWKDDILSPQGIFGRRPKDSLHYPQHFEYLDFKPYYYRPKEFSSTLRQNEVQSATKSS